MTFWTKHLLVACEGAVGRWQWQLTVESDVHSLAKYEIAELRRHLHTIIYKCGWSQQLLNLVND